MRKQMNEIFWAWVSFVGILSPEKMGRTWQAFFEKNVQLLSSALANLAEEQQKMATWCR